MTYIVTAPLVQVATDPKGVAVQVTKGGPVPENITKEALANLIDLGYVEEVDGEGAEKVPTRSSSKADWVAYATNEARGDDKLSDEDADQATRDELAELFLGPKE